MAVKVLMIFLDGVGLGSDVGGRNPLARVGAGFRALSGGQQWVAGFVPLTRPSLTFRGIDACLGVDGLPQSGTGQASLFTGVNCAALAGRHYGPLPHSSSRPVIRASNVFKRITARFGAGSAVFSNAFPPQFFEAVAIRDRWPTITRCCLDAGVRIRNLEDLAAGAAVAADVTGNGLSRYTGGAVLPRSPAEAATTLFGLSDAARFTLFEVFLTDKAGHDQSADKARIILEALDALLTALTRRQPDDLLIVLTSDHGNLEDLSVKTHTTNPVPLVALGPGADAFAGVSDLTGVAPAILSVLGA